MHCRRLTGTDHRRGLCRRCYRDPYVQERYPPLPRGSWGAAGFRCRTAALRGELLRLYDGGMSDRQIAAATGRSVAAVTKERQRMGLRVPKEREVAHRRTG